MQSTSAGRPLAFGWSKDGHYLCCVYEQIDADTILPVTAYEIED
ncbi:MAG: hypothetical protein R3E01_05705 [Pirellulaceae bacterium]